MRCRLCFGGSRRDEARPFALPGARAAYAPDRVVEPLRISLDVRLDLPRGRVAGTARHRVRVLRDEASRLRLDAVALELAAVRVDGEPAAHRYDGAALVVELGARARGDELTVEVDYAAEPKKGLYFIRPDAAHPERPEQAWTQGQDEDNRHWFPCLDHPSHKCATDVRVTVPAGLFALSNGELVEDRADAASGTHVWGYRFDAPHPAYLVTLVVGRFAALRDRHGEVELGYYVDPSRVADAPRTFARTPEMMARFEALVGRPYPYRRYSQIAVAEFIFGGMENTTATTLTDLTLHDARAHLDLTSEPLVAHELAHQWFGDLVTCREWAHGWLNEGFATYFEHLWREHADGVDAADWDRLIDREAYLEEASGRYARPIVARVYEEPIDLFDRHLYEKGGAVLHMLRRELGDAAFWRGVAAYLERHAGGTVETADLQRALEAASGWSGARFFEQWIYRAGHPRLEVTYAWDEAQRLARVEVTQKDEGEPWTLTLPVELEIDGAIERHALEVSRRAHVFHLPAAAAPTRAVVDPGRDLLAELELKKPEAVWIAELRTAPRAVDRAFAARALGKLGAATARPALVAAMAADPFWAVRGECGRALGELRGPASREAIVARLPDEAHPKARRLLVRALGAFRHDVAAAAALADRARAGDPSYLVEAELAVSLGKVRGPGAYEAIAALLDRPSHRDLVAAGALVGLAELREARGLDDAIARARYGAAAGARAAAIGAIGVLGAEHGDRRRAARELLADLALDDPDFRARLAAIDALGALGDPDAGATLARAAAGERDGRIRRRAREVLRDLERGRAASEQWTALRDRAEKLEAARDELRDRLAALEARLGPPG